MSTLENDIKLAEKSFDTFRRIYIDIYHMHDHRLWTALYRTFSNTKSLWLKHRRLT